MSRALGPGKLIRSERSGGTWVFDYKSSVGQRCRVQLGPDKRRAQRRATEIVHQRDLELAGLGAVEGQSRSLAEIRDLYLADLASRVTGKQVRNVGDRLGRVLAAIPARRVRDVHPVQLLRYRAQLVDRGASNRTANAYTDALNAMLRWARCNGLVDTNPIQSLKRLPMGEGYQKRVRRALSDDEIGRLLRAAGDDDARNQGLVSSRRLRRDVAKRFQLLARRGRARIPQLPLWTFLVRYGARYGEARTLVWGDVDFDQAVITLRAANTKTRRTRCLPISREFTEQLAELRKLHLRALGRAVGAVDNVFMSPEGRPLREDTRNAQRMFDRLLEAAGIEKRNALGQTIDIHGLRGTCATALARRNVPLLTTRSLLGHSSPVVTAKYYTRLEAEDVRRAIETPPSNPSKEATA